MAIKLANNGASTLAGGITDDATSLSVQTGDAAKFAALGGSDWFYATLFDASNNREIVKVTARAGADLTIVRGVDGTTARAWDAGTRIEMRFNKAAIEDVTEPGARVNDATAATAMADGDKVGFWQAASGAWRAITWANLYEAIRTKLGAMISANTAKTTPADADQLLMTDSASSSAPVRLSWLNLLNGVWARLGGLIAGGTEKASPVGADRLAIADSAASNATKYVLLSKVLTAFAAVAADLRAGTSTSKALTPASALEASAWVPLTDGATIPVDHSEGVNRNGSIAGNRAVGAPTNIRDGWPLNIRVQQDATGGRTLTWDSAYDFGDAGTPTLSTGANQADLLCFVAYGSKMIFLGMRSRVD